MLTAMAAAALPDDDLRDPPRRSSLELSQASFDERRRECIRIREAKLGQTIVDSFPASDPPSH
jgi:hypothetical protein